MTDQITPPLSFRDHSINAVLWHVHRSGIVSRSELGRLVGLNRSSIARVLSDLTDRQLVEPAGALRGGSRGRPSLLVQASPRGPVSLVALVTPSSIIIAVGALGGHLLHRDEVAHAAAGQTAVATLHRVVELLADVRRRYHRQGVVGGVLVAPGRVTGDSVSAPALAWEDTRPRAMLSEALRIPFSLASAADAAVVGEHMRGAGTGLGTVVHILAEPEIVAGMVLDGHLFRGASGGAGQVGHLCVTPGGSRCSCGRRGCLNAEVSAAHVARLLERTGTSSGRARGTAISPRGEDRRTLRALHTAGERIGGALQQLTSIVNPDAVVLGPPFGSALTSLRPGIVEAYRRAGTPTPLVVAAALGADSALVGGLELGLQAIFSGGGNIRPRVAPSLATREQAAG